MIPRARGFRQLRPAAIVVAALFAVAVTLPAPDLAAQELAASLRPVARPAALAAALATPPAVQPAPEPDTTPAAQPDLVPPEPALPRDEDLLPASPSIGPETNLPLPRFVSLKTDEGNVRRGPSLSHRIDWVFVREDMPLMITAEYGHWRRVVDREGLGGWVHYSLLSGSRTVIVDQDMLPIRTRPEREAPEVALLQQGVIARLGQCQIDWCRLTAGGYRGWAPKTALWGVGPDEILD
jgi:SH3-like domain-containing protein